MDRKKIERECRKLLAELDVVFRKAKAKGRIAALIIGAIFLIGGIVWIGLVGMNLQTDKIFFGAVVGTMIVFAAYGIAFELVSKPAIKTAAEAYREKFKDHRDTADEVLELIGQPRDAIDDLCRELKIKTPEQLRHQREKKKRAHAREIARGTAKSPYACGGCGAKVLVEAGGRGILWCRKCKRWLEMPKTISCPVCKSKRVGYASTESQHEPSDKGKGAGALMGGLPGVLAGAALDVVRNEIAMELNQAFAKPKFRCTSCGHLFLVKLVVK